ncbi:DUF6470 family protein [Paenibacillus sp. PL2-23]|uniref:DUF6470 family protein n=1 Tax=Paenibacillus sp. PL2-23 TaxID=2100729 RepID=UPI0030F9F98C
MIFPQLQIQSTRAKIGIRSELGHFEIKQSRAYIQIESKGARVHIDSEPAVVHIDQTKTWDALTGGKPLTFWNRIYDQSGKFVLDAIQNTVDEYNKIGNILATDNPIAEVARDSMFRQSPYHDIFGPASSDNVDFNPTFTKPDINVDVGGIDIQVQTNRPQIEYKRGSTRTYMEQYPSVHITPPKFDITL